MFFFFFLGHLQVARARARSSSIRVIIQDSSQEHGVRKELFYGFKRLTDLTDDDDVIVQLVSRSHNRRATKINSPFVPHFARYS